MAPTESTHLPIITPVNNTLSTISKEPLKFVVDKSLVWENFCRASNLYLHNRR